MADCKWHGSHLEKCNTGCTPDGGDTAHGPPMFSDIKPAPLSPELALVKDLLVFPSPTKPETDGVEPCRWCQSTPELWAKRCGGATLWRLQCPTVPCDELANCCGGCECSKQFPSDWRGSIDAAEEDWKNRDQPDLTPVQPVLRVQVNCVVCLGHYREMPRGAEGWPKKEFDQSLKNTGWGDVGGDGRSWTCPECMTPVEPPTPNPLDAIKVRRDEQGNLITEGGILIPRG